MEEVFSKIFKLGFELISLDMVKDILHPSIEGQTLENLGVVRPDLIRISRKFAGNHY